MMSTDDHMVIYLSILSLAVMVLFLIFVGIAHIVVLNRLMQRIKYIEGTTDIILQTLNR